MTSKELNRFLKQPTDDDINQIFFDKIENLSYANLFKVKVENCKNSCKNKFGDCDSKKNICYCKKGYLNHPNTSEEFSYICSYKQKRKDIAILLEIFTFIGGDIYLGFWVYALVKFLIFASLFTLFYLGLPCSLFGCGESLIQNECKPCECIKSGNIFTLLFLIFIWCIGDILILCNKIVIDYYGMPIL